MTPTSVIALFCEDIREEKSGAITLLGIMPDNAQVAAPPASADGKTYIRTVPRLGIYVRINFDVDAELGPITIRVIMPDTSVAYTENVEERHVAKARATREKGNRVGGVVSRLQFTGVPLTQLGRITVEVSIGSQTYIAGSLNFVPEEANS